MEHYPGLGLEGLKKITKILCIGSDPSDIRLDHDPNTKLKN